MMRKFERSKPYVEVGGIGQSGHGRKTLIAAITNVLAKRGLARAQSYDDVAGTHTGRGITIIREEVEYETASRHYRHTDFSQFPDDYAQHLVLGSTSPSGFILVVSAVDGVSSHCVDLLSLARQLGVSSVVIF